MEALFGLVRFSYFSRVDSDNHSSTQNITLRGAAGSIFNPTPPALTRLPIHAAARALAIVGQQCLAGQNGYLCFYALDRFDLICSCFA